MHRAPADAGSALRSDVRREGAWPVPVGGGHRGQLGMRCVAQDELVRSVQCGVQQKGGASFEVTSAKKEKTSSSTLLNQLMSFGVVATIAMRLLSIRSNALLPC